MALLVFARVYDQDQTVAVELPLMSNIGDLLKSIVSGAKARWSVVLFQNNKITDREVLLADVGIGMQATVEIVFDTLSFKIHIIHLMEDALEFPIIEFTNCYNAAYDYCFNYADKTVGHVLIMNGLIDELTILLKNNELRKHYDAVSGSLMHDAVATNNLEIAELLLKYDFPVNDYNEEYETPLEFLLKGFNPDWDMFMLLVDAGSISKMHQSDLPQFIGTWFDKLEHEEGYSRENIEAIFNF